MSGLRALHKWLLLAGWLLAAASAHAQPAAAPVPSATCPGKFPNPITDICWSCILPITLGSLTLMNIGGQEDNGDNPGSPVCSCGVNPTVGLSIGYWEPARLVEVTRKPFCMPTLGGITLDPGVHAPHGNVFTPHESDGSGATFSQAHFYLNPILYWLQVVMDFPCLERGALDLVYLTEVDPLWNDDELTLLLNPDALLFANPVAVAACAADCVAASAGFGLKSLFWCGGCQGGIYPFDGNVPYAMGGLRNAELLAHRLTAKMHRELIAWGWHGQRGLCGPYFEPVMDKTAYKTQLVYPIPTTAANGLSCNGGDVLQSSSGLCRKADGTLYSPMAIAGEGRCCRPFGRTTVLWGAGKQYPVRGEDFSFMLFRKRNCCVGY